MTAYFILSALSLVAQLAAILLIGSTIKYPEYIPYVGIATLILVFSPLVLTFLSGISTKQSFSLLFMKPGVSEITARTSFIGGFLSFISFALLIFTQSVISGIIIFVFAGSIYYGITNLLFWLGRCLRKFSIKNRPF